ncbi:MAG TPA: HAMP domain-containing sensor histidine kinase [Vicinamibacterales bacterium]|nr:HAMP domain-containing sensor histidine kinase [Vicinamibacterales bacterium]
MLRRRFPLGLMAPVALVVLVVALGALQYRWVGQVSERERDQLRESLDRRARDFSDDFDREISRAYQMFEPDPDFTPSSPERFAQRQDEWQQTAPFAGIVRGVYFLESARDITTLYRYNPSARAFEATEWPGSLAPVRARLVSARVVPDVAGPGIFTIAAPSVLTNVPALLIPQVRRDTVTAQPKAPRVNGLYTATATVDMRVTMETGRNFVIVELDKPFIASSMLPTLAQRHFPENGSDPVRVQVSTGQDDVLFSRGLAANQKIDAKSADATTGFFGLRLEVFRGFVAAAGATSAVTDATMTVMRRRDAEVAARQDRPAAVPAPGEDRLVLTAPPLSARGRSYSMVIEQSAGSPVRQPVTAGWTLALQHEAGSLDAAVAAARRRNLFLSFGILSVLAASAGLVMVNARRSEKLAAQQMEFVATVSHELRTPLAVIRSAAQNLSAGVVNDAGQAQRYGDLIESEGRRLTDMVEQVLEYAGLTDAKRRVVPRPMDTVPVLRDVVASTSSLPEASGVDFDVNIDADVPEVMADEAAFRRALNNLIGNALKYAGDGRWVGVSASRGAGPEDGFVLVSVADRGQGIASDDLPHIFEPFYRGRDAVGQQIRGNGLGLSLVKQLLQTLGGRVSVTSAPGQGSRFTLHLPVAADSAPKPA